MDTAPMAERPCTDGAPDGPKTFGMHPESDFVPLNGQMDSETSSLAGLDWQRILASAGSTSSGRVDEALLPKRETDRREVLLAFAEVDHRLRGNSKCKVCRAPVRAEMRTIGTDDQGRTFEYECLCRRCFEAEKAYCRKVTAYVGGVVFEESVNQKELVARPQPATEKVAA